MGDYLQYSPTAADFIPPTVYAEDGPVEAPTEPKAKRKKKHKMSDLGNAEYLVREGKDLIRYDPKRSKWLVWEGHTWRLFMEAPMPTKLAGEIMSGMMTQALDMPTTDPDNDPKTVERLQKARTDELKRAAAAQSQKKCKDALEMACQFKEMQQPAWDEQKFLLGAQNGVIDLRTGLLRPGQRTDYISLAAPWYDPTAQCPSWKKFLLEIFGSQEMVDWMQVALGYSITGSVREQCFFICTGTNVQGENGKSLMLEMVRKALGNYAYNMPLSAFDVQQRNNIPTDIAQMPGRRFITALEQSQGAKLDDQKVKSLTGGDSITARFFHKEWFTFSPAGKIWMATNHLPETDDDSHGFYRRIKIIPFQTLPPEKIDKDLRDQLERETPGILAWLVQGAVKWCSSKLPADPAPVKRAIEAYKQASNPYSEWLATHCEQHPEYWESTQELTKDYNLFAAANNLPKTSLVKFGRKLAANFTAHRPDHKSERGYKGLRLLTGKAQTIPDQGPGDQVSPGVVEILYTPPAND